MVDLAPVRAFLPNAAVAAPDDLVCPVYDTLSPADFAQYGTRPFNAAGFVPRPEDVPLPTFLDRAAGALAAALTQRAYVQDPAPAFYVYGIRYVPPDDILETLAPEDRRADYLLLGLLGALDFARLGHGQVALHERTFADRVAERVALTDRTGMSFAPILTGYHGEGHRLNDRIEAILGLRRSALQFRAAERPAVEARLGGTTHLLWRVTDPARIEELRREVHGLRLLILDGHHRFTAAAQRQYEGRASAPLLLLVDGSDRALQLLPWHRVLSAEVARPETLIERARAEFPEVLAAGSFPTPEAAIARLRRMQRDRVRGFLLASRAGLFEVRGLPSTDAGADFDLLHGFLDDTLHLDPEALAFLRSPRAALDAVVPASPIAPGGTAVLLPGLSARGVEARAFERGEVMAQKSTMFLPKVAEGMIFAPAALPE